MAGSSIWDPTVEVVDTQLRLDLASTASASVGAGMVGFDKTLPYDAGTVGKELKDIETNIVILASSILEGYSSITTYGAVGDGVHDDTPAFTAALAANDRIFLPNPPVCWRVNVPVAITAAVKILGENKFLTKVRAFNSSLPVFSIAGSTTNVELNNFHLERSTAASATASGVECAGGVTDITFDSLVIDGQWHGLSVSSSERGSIKNCQIMNNYGDGVKESTGTEANMVWKKEGNTISYNNGNGINVVGVGASVLTTLGEFEGNTITRNGLYGIVAGGTSTKRIQSVRIGGGVCSFNGSGGILLDTFGGNHRVVGVSSNSSGTVVTGRQAAPIAVTSIGSGIQVTGNNMDALITGCIASGNSHAGINSSQVNGSIVGNNCNNNGANVTAVASLRSGITLSGAIVTVVGNTCSNTGGATSQQQGIHTTAGINSVIADNNCSSNTVGGITIVSPTNSNRIVNNVGYNPQPAAAVTAGASPWTYTAGNSPETLYWRGGTISSLTIDGIVIATASPGTTFPTTIELGPNEAFVMTYSVVPTNITTKKH